MQIVPKMTSAPLRAMPAQTHEMWRTGSDAAIALPTPMLINAQPSSPMMKLAIIGKAPTANTIAIRSGAATMAKPSTSRSVASTTRNNRKGKCSGLDGSLVIAAKPNRASKSEANKLSAVKFRLILFTS